MNKYPNASDFARKALERGRKKRRGEIIENTHIGVYIAAVILVIVLVWIAVSTYNPCRSSSYIGIQVKGTHSTTVYIQGHSASSNRIQYAIASASQSVLWGLNDPYNNQLIVPLQSADNEMPFGIPLTACTVYLVATDGAGHQTITPVPADQVPSRYAGWVTGCDPASVAPWWVTDQFASNEFGQLPTLSCDSYECFPPVGDPVSP